MMGNAGRVIGLYTGLTGLGIVLLIFAGLLIAGQVKDRQDFIYSKALVEALSAANTADVEDLVGEIGNYQQWAKPLLQEIIASEESSPKEKLHAGLVLVKDDPLHVDFLLQRLLKARADDVPVIVKFLTPHRDQLAKQLWDYIATGSSSERIRAAAALAEYDSANKKWKQVAEDIVTALVVIPASEEDEWIEMLRPVGEVLAKPLEQRFRDNSSDRDAERPLAAAALADYLRDDPQTLTELILLADNDREFQPLLEAIRKHTESVASELLVLLSQSRPSGAEPDERDALWKRQANAAICLLELGHADSVWPLFKQTPDPSLRSFIIDRIARLGANYETLAARISKETDPISRYALILALGHFDVAKLSSQQRKNVVKQLEDLYQHDLNSGVHSAVRWALRKWQEGQVISSIDANLMNSPPTQDQSWFVNSQGQTFAIVNGPFEFLMGEKTERTVPKKVLLSHRFAVATHEVTVAQFQKFRSDYQHDARYVPQTDCPANDVNWYDAVAYCNWLTDEENKNRAKDDLLEKCYEPNEKGEYTAGMTIPADYLQRGGYRLPTEEEWAFVCRAGTTSTYGFGESVELLTKYGWYVSNAESHSWPVGVKLPNALGVFDMHGNAIEWCHSLYSDQAGQTDLEVKTADRRLLRGGSFGNHSSDVRSAYRNLIQPTYRKIYFGFRPSRTYNLSP
jgi:formylglycine-generating enzyme required for sulfatase activity